MINKMIFTGMTPSGIPHIGNYIGAIKPAIAKQHAYAHSLYFIADYHSLVKLWDAKLRREYIQCNAATWLACGLDPNKTIFFRQSQVPEILELNWILTSVAAKGLLNRAHAYKDQVAKNAEAGDKDPDAGITMGLFNYPVLMSADILAFNAHLVPVGKDQIQHIEIARDIGQRFNHLYGEVFTLPEAVVDENTQTLPGLDGRKMSKSYQNTIPLFMPEKDLRKLIMKIKTNSQPPEEPKSTEGCTLFQIYRAFAKPAQTEVLRARYASGIGWGEVKQQLFELLNAELAPLRERFDYYMGHQEEVERILNLGAEKARAIAKITLAKAKNIAGF